MIVGEWRFDGSILWTCAYTRVDGGKVAWRYYGGYVDERICILRGRNLLIYVQLDFEDES